MPRHIFTDEERSRGGKVRSSQPDFAEKTCSAGFWATVSKYPNATFLRDKIQSYNRRKLIEGGLK